MLFERDNISTDEQTYKMQTELWSSVENTSWNQIQYMS